jgi:hypothetical protein
VVTAAVALVAVFAALFAAADPAFGRLVSAAVPDLAVDEAVARMLVFGVVAGLTLTAAFVAAAPPRWTALSVRPGRPARLVEWAVPLLALDAVFAAFVALQATVLFGGHDHVARTAGLTYAEYARRGFGQLVVVTALTLLVVAVAARHAPRQDRRDRLVTGGLLGALCVMAVVVAGSALHRLSLYEAEFGATRARLLAGTIEVWLRALLVLVLVAGVRWSGRWLPRATVATAALALLTLAGVNADALWRNATSTASRRAGGSTSATSPACLPTRCPCSTTAGAAALVRAAAVDRGSASTPAAGHDQRRARPSPRGSGPPTGAPLPRHAVGADGQPGRSLGATGGAPVRGRPGSSDRRTDRGAADRPRRFARTAGSAATRPVAPAGSAPVR